MQHARDGFVKFEFEHDNKVIARKEYRSDDRLEDIEESTFPFLKSELRFEKKKKKRGQEVDTHILLTSCSIAVIF